MSPQRESLACPGSHCSLSEIVHLSAQLRSHNGTMKPVVRTVNNGVAAVELPHRAPVLTAIQL